MKKSALSDKNPNDMKKPSKENDVGSISDMKIENICPKKCRINMANIPIEKELFVLYFLKARTIK